MNSWRKTRAGPAGAGDPGAPARGSRRTTFGLAVGAVFVVLLPQQLGQDELVLLVQLLRLLPARARRHRGGETASTPRQPESGSELNTAQPQCKEDLE